MKKDYQPPRTRLQLLREVVRTRWLLLLGCSALTLLFALPMVTAGFVTEYSKVLTLRQLLQEGSADDLELCIHCFGWNFVSLLMNCLCGAVAAIALSGTGRIMQLLAWRTGVIFRQDFALGVKENYKYFLVGVVFASVAAFAVQCNLDFVHYSGENATTLVVSTALTSLAAFLLLMVGAYTAAQSLQFSLNLNDGIKNAMILIIACFPQSLLAAALLIVPFAAACLFGIGGRLVYLAVMGLFGFGFFMLATLLLCSNVFDKTIYARFHPENAGRGLAKDAPEETL